MKHRLTKDNYKHILKVLSYTVGSAIVASFITFLANVEVAPQYFFLVSIVNILLVTLKEAFNEQR